MRKGTALSACPSDVLITEMRDDAATKWLSTRRIPFLLCSLVIVAPRLCGATPINTFLIAVRDVTASDGTAGDRYGYAVAVDADTAVVGAPNRNGNMGEAYITERNAGGSENWGEVKKLMSSVPAFPGLFGFSVAISVDTVAIGEPNTGTVYIFERNSGGAENWGLVTTLATPTNANFGYSVALDGDTLVVGAFDESVGANLGQGAAYVFERNQGGPENWGQVQHLLASDGAAQDLFGGSVSVKGNTAVIGAAGADVGGNQDQGAAYVFDRNQGGSENWGQVRKLVASDGAINDQFGVSVAIDGDTVVAGAYLADIGSGTDQGAAYIFGRDQGGTNQWGQVKELVDGAGGLFFRLGISVAISGDAVVVGYDPSAQAVFFGPPFNQSGVILFQRNLGGANNWGEFQKLLASTAFDPQHQPGHVSGNGIGDAVAISGATVVAGASQDDVNGTSVGQGSVYVFVPVSGPNPTIIGQSVTVVQGDSISQTIAVVSDDVTPPGNLTVSLLGSPPAGIQVTGISNSFGRVTASVGADCATAVGSYSVSLQVEDGDGNTASATLTVNVTAHLAPTIGTYPNTTVGFGAAGTISPDVGPQENGSPFNIVSTVASAPGFTGTFGTFFGGHVTFANAGPPGNYTVTVTATDNCGLMASTTFTLNVLSALATITVNTTADAVADDGFCSLREAIVAANTMTASGAMPGECPAGLTGTNVIAFNIPGAGPHTIMPTSPLPATIQPVIIDGATQPGANCAGWPPTLQIVLNGSSAGSGADGLIIGGGASLVRGLVVQQFDQFGMAFDEGGDDTIQCNFVGTDVTGTLALGNGKAGMGRGPGGLCGFGGDLIGGTTPGQRNLISGNGIGLALCNNNRVVGNYIGTDVTGTRSLGNVGDGVTGFSNELIGGATPEARNVISGNGGNGVNFGNGFALNNQITGNFIGTDVTGTAALANAANGVVIGPLDNTVSENVISGNGAAGVEIAGGSFNNASVQRNLIGTDVTGQSPLGNGQDGVLISASAVNAIGASSIFTFFFSSPDPTQANTIAFNGRDGVRITDNSSTDNLIAYNSIHDNTALGIDLGGDGVTPNGTNPRTFPNAGQNFPVLTGALSNGVTTTINGTFNSAPNQQYTLQFFSTPACDPSGNGQGQVWLGDFSIITNGTGNAIIHTVLPVAVLPGYQITATASGPDPSFGEPETSEFSPCQPVAGVGADLAPTLTPPQVVDLQQGSLGTSASLTTASDDLTPAGDLIAMVLGVPTGFTVSGLNNHNGAISAVLGATCTESLGDHSFGLKVTDSAALMTTANVIVDIIPNTPPALGTYPNTGPLSPGTSAVVTPNAAPHDNGSVVSLSASAHGFTGSFEGDPTTGIITIQNAAPIGRYTVTVTATDNCGAQSTTTFALTVAPAMPTPTLSQWGLLLAAVSLFLLGWRRTRLGI